MSNSGRGTSVPLPKLISQIYESEDNSIYKV